MSKLESVVPCVKSDWVVWVVVWSWAWIVWGTRKGKIFEKHNKRTTNMSINLDSFLLVFFLLATTIPPPVTGFDG